MVRVRVDLRQHHCKKALVVIAQRGSSMVALCCRKERNMSKMRVWLAVALLPMLATSLSAQQAAPKMDKERAARAECFRQAREAAQAAVGSNASANPAATAEANATGTDAYYACIKKAGLQ